VERRAQGLETVKDERGMWENRWLSARAAAFRDAGDLLLFEEDLSPDSLRKLCAEILEVCGGRCAVFSGSDKSGYAYAIGQAGGDLRAFVKEMNAALNGRGGGKPGFAQGRVGAARADIEEYFTK
jgi:alanyl-tRNA synthetase